MKFQDGRLLELQAISALLMKKIKTRMDKTGMRKEDEREKERERERVGGAFLASRKCPFD